MVLIVVSRILFHKRVVSLLWGEEHARLDVTARQRLDTVQDLMVAPQQIRPGSKQTKLVTIVSLIFVELVDLFAAAAKLLEEW